MRGRLLIVDDDPALCDLLQAELEACGFSVCGARSAEHGLAHLEDGEFDAVLTDLRMPELSGIDLSTRIAENRPNLPVVAMTAFGSLDLAIEAIRAGVYDFVTKPIEVQALVLVLDRAVLYGRLQDQVRRLQKTVEGFTRLDALIGESPPMQDVFRMIQQIGDTEAPVMITGESGVGKELVARSLHDRSPRRSQPFVAINCAALTESLLESELFGHVRGAFTDARSARKGLIEEARGGTLLLDEIGDMSLAMQAKLLRVLEEGRARPVGADREVKVDFRLLTATNKDLESAVEEQRFRNDLFFRINVIQLEMPPLRSRGNDILLLAQHFLTEFADRLCRPVTGLSRGAARKLLAYSWPGNVRELRNCIERAVSLTRHGEILVEDLPERIRGYRARRLTLVGDDPRELVSLEEVERRYIQHVLSATAGNRTLASRVLGIDRKTLYRKLSSYDESDDRTT